MSETAQTLIKAAMRVATIIASGETASADEMADGFETLKIMLRSWSDNIDIFYQDQDTLTMDGSASYTIGSGGDIDTTWPTEIVGAVVDGEIVLRIIGEAKYRRLGTLSIYADPGYLWYNPEYPLGLLHPWPTGGSSMVIDSLKLLSEPSTINDSIAFPPPYDAAIKWNLAVELGPEYGIEPSATVINLAEKTLRSIQSKNFARQVNATSLNLISSGGIYRIDQG